MKVIQINSVYGVGSTGRIAMDLQSYMNANDVVAKTIYGYGNCEYPMTYKMQSMLELRINIAAGRTTGHHGNYNRKPTARAIKFLDSEKPDIIHLHNIHGYYINVPMLMNYIREHQIPVVWTFHDCWPFTGHCCYFDDYHCEKWKTGCKNCPAWRDEYSILFGDRSEKNWNEKKKMFMGLNRCVLVSPSQWLANFFPDSFLKEYPSAVIHNGIDTDAFRPTRNDIKAELGISDRRMVLGIVPDLDGPKGGRYLLELARRLGDDYAVVLLSLKTTEQLPDNVYVLEKTNSTKRLAEVYSAADVFVNPTLHDNYPTVNLESTACGTPVVTFKTGGSPEGVINHYGSAVDKADIDSLVLETKRWCESAEKRKKEIDYSQLNISEFAEKYIRLYRDIIHSEKQE